MTVKTITNSAEESKDAALRMALLFHSGERWDEKASGEWIRLQLLVGHFDRKVEATSKVLCNAVRHALAQKSDPPAMQSDVQIRCVDEDGTEVDFRPTEELMVKRLAEQELRIRELEAIIRIAQAGTIETSVDDDPYHGCNPYPVPE